MGGYEKRVLGSRKQWSVTTLAATSVSDWWGSSTVLEMPSYWPPPLHVFKNPTLQHTHTHTNTQQTRDLFIESAKPPLLSWLCKY